MTRILIVSEHPFQATAYALMAKDIAEYLAGFYEVYYFPITYIPSPGIQFGRFTLLGAQLEAGGVKVFNHYVDSIQPEVIIYEGDAFACPWVLTEKSKVILRAVIDGDIPRPAELELYRKATVVTALTRMAKDILSKDYNTYYIPNFYHEEVFHGQREEHEGFRFLYVGTNVFRKNVAGLIQAFARVAKEMPDAKLCLHCTPLSRYGFFLPDIIEHFDLQKRVEFSPNVDLVPYPASAMARLYASADAFVSTTSGEGFGIPHLEAMAMGLPQAYPDFSALQEVVGDAGIAVPIAGYLYDYWGVKKAIVDTEAFAKAMLALYEDKSLRSELGRRGIRQARQYEYKQVVPLWRECIEEVLK